MLLTVLQAGIDLNELAIIGVGAVVSVMILAILAQIGLSYLGQRNLNDQLSLGMQAIVGANNLRVVDNQQDDGMTLEDNNNDNNNNN
ncbi:hypothetical protein OSG_eHP42_00035 [environmental Halophage eHP-42]|jgi:hypothetical protein|nr:hypothetical protein OSG_eHP42_00035 [environmental Halophage eHP-42]